MEKSLIIMPNWIGDVALALSVVIRRAEAGRTQPTLLVPQHFVDLCSLLCGLPAIPYHRATHGDFLSTVSRIRGERFEKAHILPISFSSAWLAFRAGIRNRRGISRECRGILLTEALPGRMRNVKEHLTREYATVLETPFLAPETWQARTSASLREKSPYKNSVVFCPGSKYGPAKRWPWFGELARRLSGETIVLLGDDDETETGKAVEATGSGNVTNLIGKTSLAEVVSIIAAAKLVVSNDSGLMHIAGFLGTPVVGIFGSTSPVWTRPLGGRAKIATTNCECSPCFSRTCAYSHYNCLKNISPEKVASLADQLLRS